jgi:uncharacterized protein YgiM (DUF1202 family)
MARASLVAIVALLLTGACTTGCTNATDDDPDDREPGVVSPRKRDPNTASGEIGGDPQTPRSAEPSGDDETNSDTDEADGDDAAPPASGDPNTPPPPPPDPDPIPTGSFAAGTELVTTANLNIREGADTTFAIVTTVPNGSRVVVETVSGATGWVNVSYNGNVGWSSKSYLTVP